MAQNRLIRTARTRYIITCGGRGHFLVVPTPNTQKAYQLTERAEHFLNPHTTHLVQFINRLNFKISRKLFSITLLSTKNLQRLLLIKEKNDTSLRMTSKRNNFFSVLLRRFISKFKATSTIKLHSVLNKGKVQTIAFLNINRIFFT